MTPKTAEQLILSRVWCMPCGDTLSIKPIKELFHKYSKGLSTIDPFARNCDLCSFTNDLNPETKAQNHLYADKFLSSFENLPFVVFDPPYSLRQVKEIYDSVGTGFTHKDSQNAMRWTIERDIISERQKPGNIVMSLGWTTSCMGKKRGYKIIEILLVSHGAAHNDTIVTVERKL